MNWQTTHDSWMLQIDVVNGAVDLAAYVVWLLATRCRYALCSVSPERTQEVFMFLSLLSYNHNMSTAGSLHLKIFLGYYIFQCSLTQECVFTDSGYADRSGIDKLQRLSVGEANLIICNNEQPATDFYVTITIVVNLRTTVFLQSRQKANLVLLQISQTAATRWACATDLYDDMG